MTVQAIKLLLVEDSSVLAERLSELIGEITEIQLVGMVDTESAALAELKQRRIHIVVLDLHLKQGTGFGILRAMSTMPQKPRIVVLTNHDKADYQGNAVALGATAFLDKARDFERLPQLLSQFVGEFRSQ
jgi:two-component system OmpR family response regulator